MLPGRYSTRDISKAIKNPDLIWKEIGNLITPLRKKCFQRKYGNSCDVTGRDWDNLFILDACRYDFFEEYNHLDGDLESVVSGGSSSPEFIDSNFNDRQLHDTIYISANPYTDKTLNEGVFHKVIKTYEVTEFTERGLQEHDPGIVSDIATDYYSKFKDKRIIVHFMQPHTPYLGPTAEKLREELQNKGIRFIQLVDNPSDVPPSSLYKSLLGVAQDGYISYSDIEKCYVENLKIVLDEVKILLDQFEGKSVVTSDHGELLGTPSTRLPIKRRYQHGQKMYVPELRIVPWLTINSDDRRDIVASEPLPSTESSEENLNKQLEALGYKT